MQISKIQQLPPEVKAWLDQQLVKHAFGNYDELTQQLNAKLAEHNLEISVSRTGLGNYGKSLKDRIEKIRASTEAAKLLGETINDEGDALAAANIALSQDIIFQLLQQWDPEDEDKPQMSVKDMSGLFRALGNISRASLPLKKWQKQVRVELQRKKEEAAASIQADAGLNDEQAAIIRAKILGINLDE
jgi:hypothetical protein